VKWLLPIAFVWVIPALLNAHLASAGHVWGTPAECTGFYDILCRTNYDPFVHDQMFIRDVDELGPDSAALGSALTFAQNRWNDLGVGPQRFAASPDIGDSYNFIKPKTTLELCQRIPLGCMQKEVMSRQVV
jgi:hypothetical protein